MPTRAEISIWILFSGALNQLSSRVLRFDRSFRHGTRPADANSRRQGIYEAVGVKRPAGDLGGRFFRQARRRQRRSICPISAAAGAKLLTLFRTGPEPEAEGVPPPAVLTSVGRRDA